MGVMEFVNPRGHRSFIKSFHAFPTSRSPNLKIEEEEENEDEEDSPPLVHSPPPSITTAKRKPRVLMLSSANPNSSIIPS